MSLSAVNSGEPRILTPEPRALPPELRLPALEPPLDVQALWFELQRREWTTLALVPAEPCGPTMPIALALSSVCARQRGRQLLVLPGEKVDLTSAGPLLAQLLLAKAHAGEPGRDQVVIPLGPLSVYPSAVAVARAADCAVLCVELHLTRLSSARRAIELVGKDRFLGYLALERSPHP